ncbi:WD40-repeat-containing domain protein [Tribonema minus]|uniref:WD40 repeat-containing protein SMU1 n=1 Tax=Tribonema minus TaxID=303371 RepID=A0A835ZIM7_9STRA|nr:WD40-repeat-containing domain protein [Tribonema minus]
MALEIESEDVLRLIMQYLKEHNLTSSLKTLQSESKVCLDTVDNLDNLSSDINHGRWESVLPQVSGLALPLNTLVALYEQVVLELLEMREGELARELLRTAEPFAKLKVENPERFLKLEHWVKRACSGGGTSLDPRDLYAAGNSREKRRAEVADAVLAEASVVAPSRLLALLGQALKWQQLQGQLPPRGTGGKYDLFRGAQRARRRDEEERPPRKLAGQIKFGKDSRPESARFSPDGLSLASGGADGFIELYDPDSCRLRKDLEYQAKDELMMHDTAVLCQGFSRDGEHLATGSADGKLKIWKVSTGQCLRRFESAHGKGITCAAFSHDGSQVLTTSFDQTVRIHGLKSGRTLKEFRGHGAFVNAACFTADGARIVSGAADGEVKVWDAKTMECLVTFRPRQAAIRAQAGGTGLGDVGGMSLAGMEAAVHTIVPMPGSSEHLLVATRSTTAYLITQQGAVVKSFSLDASGTGAVAGGDFTCACASPRGRWVFVASDDGKVHCFNAETGEIERTLAVGAGEVSGMTHHPHRNLLATFGKDGMLKLWKA